MTRTFFSLFSVIVLGFSLQAQSDYNLQFLSNPNNPCGSGFNDVWGFEHSNGTEYAILGTRCGTTVYDLSNPAAPTLVIDVAGAPGTWRDMKTWGDMVYSVADQGSFGIQVIDLSDLGDIKSWIYKAVAGPGDTLRKAHNLFIDAMGFLYVAGSPLNSGGVVILDLNQNDSIPPIVGYGPNEYAHDVYVNEARSLMITSDIYLGVFTLSSLNRNTIPIEVDILATQETNSHFTHNAWTSDDGNIVFTTDERNRARIGSYDISNPDEIVFLGDYTPYNAVKSSVIPHNVHVRDQYLIISHYSEGVKIVDAARPSNLVEIGSYDTHAGTSGFSGCWGAFPFFSSDIVLGSDISNGLFVLQPDYTVEVGYLEGIVKTQHGAPIDSAFIVIMSIDSTFEYSLANGQYATGIVDQNTLPAAVDNTVRVVISKTGYVSKDTMISFMPGQVINQDFILSEIFLPIELLSFSVRQIDCENKLSWTVGESFNHSHFELELSQDGQQFVSAQKIYPSQSINNTYHFVDDTQQELTYYRLKQVDIDGTEEYSKVLSQTNHCLRQNDRVTIYPNPTLDFLRINSNYNITEVKIFNNAGIEVGNISNASGEIDLSHLPSGVYWLSIKSDSKTFLEKFSKIN